MYAGKSRYALSLRDLEEIMQERGIKVDHSTINRWVLKYAPELDLRIRSHLQPTNEPSPCEADCEANDGIQVLQHGKENVERH